MIRSPSELNATCKWYIQFPNILHWPGMIIRHVATRKDFLPSFFHKQKPRGTQRDQMKHYSKLEAMSNNTFEDPYTTTELVNPQRPRIRAPSALFRSVVRHLSRSGGTYTKLKDPKVCETHLPSNNSSMSLHQVTAIKKGFKLNYMESATDNHKVHQGREKRTSKHQQDLFCLPSKVCVPIIPVDINYRIRPTRHPLPHYVVNKTHDLACEYGIIHHRELCANTEVEMKRFDFGTPPPAPIPKRRALTVKIIAFGDGIGM